MIYSKQTNTWHQSLQLLTKTLYRKYQHVSLYNPIKCTNSGISVSAIGKSKFSSINKSGKKRDPLFRDGLGGYRLPNVTKREKAIGGLSSGDGPDGVGFSQYKDQGQFSYQINKNVSNVVKGNSNLSISKKKIKRKLPIQSQKQNISTNTDKQPEKTPTKQPAQNPSNPTSSYPSTNSNTLSTFGLPHKNLQTTSSNSKNSTGNQWDMGVCLTATARESKELRKFNRALFEECKVKLGDRDRYFWFVGCFVNQFCRILVGLDSEKQDKRGYYLKMEFLDKFIQDMQLLNSLFHRSSQKASSRPQSSVQIISLLKHLTIFKKSSQYFEFRLPQSRLLFHTLSAQLQLYQNNLKKYLNELQFCQYYSRKEGMEMFTLCFLWEMANVYIGIMGYEEADACLRNLLEMAVVCARGSAIKYVFEKISLVYYYRGNSIMGQYYLNKAQQGLTPFQSQIYQKQYNKQDQLQRLQQKLFNSSQPQNGSKIQKSPPLKRKNNPKYQADIWRQSKQDYQKYVQQYHESLNKMLKDYKNGRDGMRIKGIVKKVGMLGTVDKKEGRERQRGDAFGSFHVGVQKKDNGCTVFRSKIRNTMNEQPQDRVVRNSTTQYQQALLQTQDSTDMQSQKPPAPQFPQQNITKIIKSHLSNNRQGNACNKLGARNRSKEIRFRNFVKFLIGLEREAKGLREFYGAQLGAKDGGDSEWD